MNKYITIGILAGLVLALSGCSEMPSMKSNDELMKDLKEIDKPMVEETMLIDSESREFIFHSVYRTMESNGTVAPNISINLYLGEDKYYPIKFPSNITYVTDNSKYIYAVDGSASISVISNVDKNNLSKVAAIDNAVTKGKALITTDPKSKSKKREAAIYLEGKKCVVLRTYNNFDVYDTVVAGLSILDAPLQKSAEFNLKNAKLEIPNSRQYNDGFEVVATAGLGNNIQKIYTLYDGSLNIAKEMRQFDDAINGLSAKAAVVSSSEDVDYYFNDGKKCYFEIGDTVCAAYSANFNTTYTCFGTGREAKYNVIEFLKSQGD